MTHPLRWLFIDFDSYFASVEQHLNPRLRGQPIAVVPMMSDWTSCIAASYPAKAHGIRTGTIVRDARLACPEIVFVEANQRIYVEYHHRFKEIIERYIPIEKTLSIDEVSCHLPHHARDPKAAKTLAAEIKSGLSRYVSPHITCSIGIAPNTFLAKLASKYRKPNGGHILLAEDVPSFLSEHELRDLNGIGKQLEQRLRQNGIYTTAQLYQASEKTLYRIWGSHYGSRMWRFLRCEDLPHIKTSRSSIGHGHTLSPEKRSPHCAITVMHRLLQKAAFRLRKMGYVTGNIILYLKFTSGQRWIEEARFDKTSLTLALSEAANQLWSRRPTPEDTIKKIQVSFTRIREVGNYTPTLWTAYAPKKGAVDDALDQIVSRFGKHAAYYGSAHGGNESTQMKIAFNHIPNIALEE